MPGGFSIYARLILPVLGAVAGWFVFEEMIVAAAIAVLLGTASWFSYKKEKIKQEIRRENIFIEPSFCICSLIY